MATRVTVLPGLRATTLPAVRVRGSPAATGFGLAANEPTCGRVGRDHDAARAERSIPRPIRRVEAIEADVDPPACHDDAVVRLDGHMDGRNRVAKTGKSEVAGGSAEVAHGSAEAALVRDAVD